MRVQAQRLAPAHRRPDAERLGLVAGGEDHAAADDDRSIAQARMVALLDRRVEGVEVELALPFERHDAAALDATLDDVRSRFGAVAVTRAVLLGCGSGPTVPMLPD